MRQFMILSAALALGSVGTFPGSQALGISSEAQAQQGERRNAGNRQGRRNRADGQANRRRGTANAPQASRNASRRATNANRNRTQRPAVAANRDNSVSRRNVRSRDVGRRDVVRPARRLPTRAARRFDNRRFCIRPRRIQRRLYRQGWDVASFRRAGRTFHANARNRHGQRHQLTINACDGHIITARNVEPRRKSKLKRTLRSIRKTFKKIF